MTRGRKVPRGTIGTVKLTVATDYGMRALVAGPDGEVWTAAKNCDVVDPENYLGDWQSMVEDAADAALAP